MSLDLKNVSKKVNRRFGAQTVTIVEERRPAIIFNLECGKFAVQDKQVWGMGGDVIEEPPKEFWEMYNNLRDVVKEKLGLTPPGKRVAKVTSN